MPHDVITARALRLAEEFLAGARVELLELAHDDLDELKTSATELRALASDHSSEPRTTEHIAYVALASAFNEALTKRNGKARS